MMGKQHALASPSLTLTAREEQANKRTGRLLGLGGPTRGKKRGQWASKPQLQGSSWNNAQKVEESGRHLVFCSNVSISAVMFECQLRRDLEVSLRLRI